MTKTCPDHGETEELYFGYYEMYARFARYWKDGKGTNARQRAHGRSLVPRQLRPLFEPSVPHGAVEYHSHQPL